MLCGPGAETAAAADDDAIEDLSQTGISRGGSFGGGLDLPAGFGPRPQAMPIGECTLIIEHFKYFKITAVKLNLHLG